MLVCWDTQEQLGHSLKQVGGVGRPPVVGGGSLKQKAPRFSFRQTAGGWGRGCDIQGHAGPGDERATERIKSTRFRKSQVTGRINGKGSQGRSCSVGRRRKASRTVMPEGEPR